ncbi:MAG: FecR domain-containing protein [Rubripirellula sp.]
MNQTIEALIDKAINETASQEELLKLEEHLLSDSLVRERYLHAVNMHAALRRQFVSRPDSIAPESITRESITRELPGRSHLGKFAALSIVVACAACLMLIAGAFPIVSRTRQVPAVIAETVGAYRDSGVAYVSGELLDSGPMTVSRGIVRLDFSSGASVAVEGPAQLDLVDEMRLVLHRGVVTATVPESASGFVIDTDSAHVVDLGTAFGVSVSHAGQTDVCVFEGEVEVSTPPVGRESQQTQLLREGEAIRSSKASNSIDSVAFESSQFENTWPVSSGVLQTTGAIRFVKPGPEFHPGNYQDNENIVVFPERENVLPGEEVRVDMVDPGVYAKSPYREKRRLPSDQRVTSYLLQLDAYPEGKNPDRRRSVRGQITFANPIVGVITMDRLLRESEVIFGVPDVSYPSPRTIEPRPAGDQRRGFDSLTLAADRRTLLIELQENPGHLDQVRVLIETGN